MNIKVNTRYYCGAHCSTAQVATLGADPKWLLQIDSRMREHGFWRCSRLRWRVCQLAAWAMMRLGLLDGRSLVYADGKFKRGT